MIAIPTRRTSALEYLAWVGMVCVLLQLAVRFARPLPMTAAFGPADLSAWADAIGHAIEVLTMAVGAVVIAYHRWRKGDDEPPPTTPGNPGC